MNSLEFLKAILPDNGIYFLGIMQAGRHGVAHKSYTSIEDMAAAAAKYDAAPNITVYHALAAYKEKSVTVGDKVKYRTADNVSHLKTFWADMDCGTEKAAAGKGYPDKTTAAKAMVAFCNASGFPRPMFVDSGNGLHAYWPLTEAIGADEWRGQNRRRAAFVAGAVHRPTAAVGRHARRSCQAAHGAKRSARRRAEHQRPN